MFCDFVVIEIEVREGDVLRVVFCYCILGLKVFCFVDLYLMLFSWDEFVECVCKVNFYVDFYNV